MQISEDLELSCAEFRDRLNLLEREVEAAGGAFVGAQVSEKLDVQTNVLHDMRANQRHATESGKNQQFSVQEPNLADENIENFLPD